MATKSPRKHRRKPTQARAQETENAILQATAQILSRSGSSKCSTNHIAERAGVSIGALYQYFRNREAILLELFEREIEEDARAIETVLQSAHGCPVGEVTLKLVQTTLDRMAMNPRLRQILRKEVAHSRSTHKLARIKKQISRSLAEYVTMQPGFSDAPVEKLEAQIHVLVDTVEAAFNSALEVFGPRLDPARLAQEINSLILHFLSRYAEHAESKKHSNHID